MFIIVSISLWFTHKCFGYFRRVHTPICSDLQQIEISVEPLLAILVLIIKVLIRAIRSERSPPPSSPKWYIMLHNWIVMFTNISLAGGVFGPGSNWIHFKYRSDRILDDDHVISNIDDWYEHAFACWMVDLFSLAPRSINYDPFCINIVDYKLPDFQDRPNQWFVREKQWKPKFNYEHKIWIQLQ